jgi:hypothetical protein
LHRLLLDVHPVLMNCNRDNSPTCTPYICTRVMYPHIFVPKRDHLALTMLNVSPTWEYQSPPRLLSIGATLLSVQRCMCFGLTSLLIHPFIYIRARGWNTLCQTTNTNDEAILSSQCCMLHRRLPFIGATRSPRLHYPSILRCETLSALPFPAACPAPPPPPLTRAPQPVRAGRLLAARDRVSFCN